MRKQFVIVVGCIISTVASAQEWKPALDKWRSCADAAAIRYSKSTESAPVAARLAALSCVTEKKQVLDVLARSESARISEDYVDTVETHYIDVLAVKIIEMRLK